MYIVGPSEDKNGRRQAPEEEWNMTRLRIGLLALREQKTQSVQSVIGIVIYPPSVRKQQD